MYKRILLLFLLCLSLKSFGQETRPTLAVLDFNVISGLSPSEALTLTNIFRTSIFETKKYTVLERKQMQSILKEQAFDLSGVCNSTECAVKIGQLLSAEKIVIGDIGKIGETYSVTVRLLDVSTGRIENSVNERHKGSTEELADVFDVMAQKLSGTYVESSNLWWYVGGAMVVGAGVAAAVLLSGKDNPAQAQPELVGTPPANPATP